MKPGKRRSLKIAVLVDAEGIQRFALDALDAIEDTDELTFFVCSNTRFTRKWLRHGLYYAVNLVTVRNPLTKQVPISAGRKAVVGRTEFASEYAGIWQRLPQHIVDALNAGGFNVVLKFGMGLLRVPQNLGPPILSYHHGDPDLYRGRPAGFWEMIDRAPVVGQIVQIISDRLDAGKVVAFAETRVFPWSYRATLIEAFRHSPLIINSAIRNAVSGVALPKPCNGRNCRLPTNGQTLFFVSRMAGRFIGRLLYGAFVEKRWRVSIAPLPREQIAAFLERRAMPPADSWEDVPVSDGYTFYADPFFTTDPPGILVEALNARTGQGEIVFVHGRGHRRVCVGAGHMSYPAVAAVGGRQLILPETASWSPPLVCMLENGALEPICTLELERGERVVDGTLLKHQGRIYLFGNRRESGTNALYLWSAESLDGLFTLHPASPVRISPVGGRMGGSVLRLGDRLIRFGQDGSRRYGNNLVAFEIKALTRDEYAEVLIGSLSLQDRHGPHTLNFGGGEIVFDWFVERFSPLAAVRRLRARRSAMVSAPGSS